MKPNSRLVAGGVASALLGGGVTAALLLAPASGNAATDTTSTEVVDDDTGTSESEETTDDAGAELREALQPLIDNGTLTEEQVDAIVGSVMDIGQPQILTDGPLWQGGPNFPILPGGGPGDPGWPGDRPRHERMMIIGGEVIAEAVGIDVETLIDQLRGGATIAEIAEANGVDPQTVIDALVADYTERVTDWVNGETATPDDDSTTDETEATDTATETTAA